MKSEVYDVIVVGSGFAGSILAMIARTAGLRVALVEKGKHPRFAIGESSTPLSNLLLEEIADEFDLPFLRDFSKWGTWQAKHPEVGCGLKRGFTFFHHRLGETFPNSPNESRGRQLLVAASPHDRVGDTHWYRPDFDRFLVDQAKTRGVDYFDETLLETFAEDDGASPLGGLVVTGRRAGEYFELRGQILFDATGPRGFLHRALSLPHKTSEHFPATHAIYSHFRGVKPLPAKFHAAQAPYPVEAAAVHHIFDGGWIWVLKFSNGITSAGAVATLPVAEKYNFDAGEVGWKNLLRELPSLAESFYGAEVATPFVSQQPVFFHSSKIAGQNWALLPSAAGSIDPLLSTGIPLTLLGVQRLGRILVQLAGHNLREVSKTLSAYEKITHDEFETTAKFVGGLYKSFSDFEQFSRASLIYFAAASYSEWAHRLGKQHLARRFLLSDRADFRSVLDGFAEQKGKIDGDRLREDLTPFDVIGLTEKDRHPWYPANDDDLLQRATMLDSTPDDIRRVIQSQ